MYKQIIPGLSGLSIKAGSACIAALAFAGVANAQATPAGQSVENTFTLDYAVDGADQPTITNDTDNAGDPDFEVQGAETLFTVDRLIDLTVTETNSPLSVAPGASALTTPPAALTFLVRNLGNDNQSFSFQLEDPSAGDDFDATDLVIEYVRDVDGDGDLDDETAFSTLTETAVTDDETAASFTADIAPDEEFLVRVTGTIPLLLPDGVTPLPELSLDDIALIAQVRQPAAWLVEAGAVQGGIVSNDVDGNTTTGLAENVFADGVGLAEFEDADPDALFGDIGTFQVISPELTGAKTIDVVETEGEAPGFTCDGAPVPADNSGEYAVPGACILYTITVTNNGETAASVASGITVTDVLPTGVRFVGAEIDGFDAAPTPTLTEPAAATVCDFDAANCSVQVTDATLSPVVGATPAVATLRIWAIVE